MKVLYFSNICASSEMGIGVFKKVHAQCKILQTHAHDVFLACCQDVNTFTIVNKNTIVHSFPISGYRGPSKDRKIFKQIHIWLAENNIDILYSRYETYSTLSATFYRKVRKLGVHILLEVPTYPLSQRWTSIRTNLKCRNYLTAIKQFYGTTIGSMGIYRYKYVINRIVTNNGFNTIFGVPTIKITNGVDVKSLPINRRTRPDNEIKLIAVANVARWHGYDRIIKGLYDYYQRKTIDYIIRFDIVGPGSEIDHLYRLAKNLGVDTYVRFLGLKSGHELTDLINNADIGISVLGAHRSKMTVCDSLKSREYTARCLPFITQTIEYSYANIPFVLRCPSDESNIDMDDVIKFLVQVESSDIKGKMRDYAYKNCDWSVAFAPVCQYIASLPQQ